MLAITIVIALSGALGAQAVTHDIVKYPVSPKGNVWQLNTQTANPPFSGKDVNPDSVVATIWHTCQNNPELHPHTVKPKQVVLNDKFIILIFDRAELPSSAEYTKVTGSFQASSDTFSAQGPGFVVCFIGC